MRKRASLEHSQMVSSVAAGAGEEGEAAVAVLAEAGELG